MNGVSIIICCHNSAGRIAETLKHLWIQETGGFPFEIVLVDNNCADDTVGVANREWIVSGQRIPLRIVGESVPGLSAARIKGVTSASFEYALFCDDDNWLGSDYVKRAHDVMERDPKIGILGGSSTAHSDVDLPDWFEPVKGNYAVGFQSTGGAADTSGRSYLWGAGMVFRKNVLEAMIGRGVTSVLSDRTGKDLSSGGDSELCKWFLMLGYSLWYDPELKFTHFLESDRLTDKYYAKMIAKQAKAYSCLLFYDSFTEFVRLEFFERQCGYVKGAFKMLLNMMLSPNEEKALSLLLGRKIGNGAIDPLIFRNISLLLGMKRAPRRSRLNVV